ncbi:MAG: SU10 major capsid protein [Acidimicrobiia bacterium]
MTIVGVRLSDDYVTDARPRNWREGSLLLFPNGKAPLFALTTGMKKKVTDDPDFNWWEKVMPTQRVALATGTIGTGSPIAAVAAGDWNAAGIKAGHVIKIEQTGEIILVTADPTTASANLTVTRGWQGTTATAFDPATSGANPNVHTVGTQFEENSQAPTGVSYDPTKRTNFTQIFRDTLGMSRTAQKTRLRTGDAVREAKRETLEMHSANIEKAMWMGKPDDTSTINGEIARSTGGIFHYIETLAPQNVIDVSAAPYSGAFSLANLEDWLELAFRFGSSEKVGFCGNQAMLQIQRAVRLGSNVSYNFSQGQKEFGMNVMRLTSPFGTIVLKTHPLWNQVTGGTNTTDYYGLNSWLCLLDMENVVYRWLTDSDTMFEQDLQANGLDGILSGYLTECGLELHHAQSHFLIKNLQGAEAG